MTRRIGALVRFWLTFEESVDRKRYLRHGLGLGATKYAVDASLVGVATGSLWLPWDYLTSAPLLSAQFAEAPPWLAPALVIWTLPFLWIGVTMTLRRLLDAGGSAWLSLLFFIPLVNYALMFVLCLLGTSTRHAFHEHPGPAAARLPSALLSMAAGAALGLAMLYLSVELLASYGLALFMGTPFTVGTVTGFLLCRSYRASARETIQTVVMTAMIISGAALVLGFEGIVCLLMLVPLGLVLAIMGGLLGRSIARAAGGSFQGAVAFLLLPSAIILEGPTNTGSLREVRSSIEIEASANSVWEHVIAFEPLGEPTNLLFRLGVAYPTEATIDGVGVGAIRYCVFSTGAFIEPITAWEHAVRLAFDVVENPPPLEELSLFEIAPPHLTDYLVARRGEFRIVELSEQRVRLEGSTWYEQRLRPEGYWVLFSDPIIRSIHGRVLNHIKSQAEGSLLAPSTPSSF